MPGADAVREAWNKLIQYNNKRKVSTSKEVEDKVKESNSEKMRDGSENNEIIIQDPGGSYMYDKSMDKWYHRGSCYSCPERVNGSGKVYKDSTYRNLPESSVPQNIRNQIK